jgi:hypothetical protein
MLEYHNPNRTKLNVLFSLEMEIHKVGSVIRETSVSAQKKKKN